MEKKKFFISFLLLGTLLVSCESVPSSNPTTSTVPSTTSSTTTSSQATSTTPWGEDAYQTLRINSRPSKTEYTLGDKIDLTGLKVSVTTTYYEDGERKRVTTELPMEALTFKIDDQDIDSNAYVFNTVGRHVVTVSFQGHDQTIKANFNLTSSLKDLAKPENVTDPTIQWDTDSDSMKIHFTNPNRTSSNASVAAMDKGNSHKGYLDPTQVEVPYYAHTFGLHNYDHWQYSPSINTSSNPTTNFLVIPIVAPGKSSMATPDLWNTINKVFFGNSDSLYFESLKSYYEKSSYHQLHIAGNVTDYYYPEFDSKDYNTDAKISTASGSREGRKAFFDSIIDWVKNKYTSFDLKDYDQNKDGILDGVWFVYVYDKTSSSNVAHWAYSSSTQEDPNVNAPTINNYGWVTSAFLNTNSKGTKDEDGDAHVVIHESGHMFGLKDYYTTDGNSYAPLGYTDMMERNVGDHNPFSKLYMGWVKPYIVYGDDVTIEIPSSQAKDSMIVIPYDSKSYEKDEKTGKYLFNMFDEYLVLDYYTPKNLNSKGYESYSATPLPVAGGRLYHVDNRLGVITGKNEDKGTYTSEMIPDATVDQDIKKYFSTGANDYKVQKVISNTLTNDSSHYGLTDPNADQWDELRLIDAKGRYLGENGVKADADTLFYSNKNSASAYKVFDLTDAKYSSQFVNEKFDNNQQFSYRFEITGFPANN